MVMKVLTIGLLFGLSGCGTVEGIGRDISDGARSIRGVF